MMDLWSQIWLLDEGKRLGSTITAYRNRYFYAYSRPGAKYVTYNIIPERQIEIHQKIEDICFRLKAEDYLELPKLVKNTIPLTLPTKLRKQYDKLEQEFIIRLKESKQTIAAFSKSAVAIKLRQFLQGGIYNEEGEWFHIHDEKVNALKSILEETTSPVLCAIQFRAELKMIQDVINGGKELPCLVGSMDKHMINHYIRMWNVGKIPLLLCHPATVAHGLNLQAGGNVLVWYGMPWSYEHYVQLIGRLHRQGQTKPVIVHHLVMRDTVDDRIQRALRSKKLTSDALLEYLRNETDSCNTTRQPQVGYF